MTCNCGDNEYNIEINNNGSCEPTTPIYNITLDNVGIDGFSPLVNFVNQTDESFNIAIEDVIGIHTSPAVPLYDWVNNNLNDIRYQLSNLDLSDYLKNNGTNAADTLNLNRLRLITNNNSKQSIMTNDGTQLRVSGQGITIDGYATSGQAYPHSITIAASGSSITIGNSHYKNIVLDNTSARYNGYEIATTNDIGNGTITITQGGTTKGTFTVNQSGNSTIDLDGAIISNPITIDATSGYNGNAVLYAPGAYAFDTSAGTRLESIWTDTVESVEHRYTHGLYINNGGRYYEYPKIEYIKEDYIPSEGSSTSSSTALGFINTSLYSTIPGITAPIYITRVGAGYTVSLKYDNDTLKVNQDGKLYADVQGGSSYTAGDGIDITNNTISIDSRYISREEYDDYNVVIVGDGNCRVRLEGDSTRPYYKQGIRGTALALYTDLPSNFSGCDSIYGGTAGLVPAPSAGDQDKFLKADGTWDTVGGGGGSSYTAGTGIDITNDTISVESTQEFDTVTIANTIGNSGEGLYGTTADGSSSLSLVRIDSLDSVLIGNTTSDLYLFGDNTRPYYNNSTNTLALSSDIPTVNNSTITFTQGGVTKGTITLNQSTDTTIALDAGGGTPSNMVTTNTAQTITGIKTFGSNAYIQSDQFRSVNDDLIFYTGNSNYCYMGYYGRELRLDGSSTRPKYSTDNNTYSEIALYSDIPDMTDYYDKTETDTLLDGKQDELTTGDGIDINLVYPDVLENTYEQYNTSTSTWEAIANPSNWSLGPNKMARIFTGQSLLYSRSWELTSKLPSTNGVGIAFSKDSGNQKLGFYWLFRITTISTNTITFSYGTNKGNSSLEISGSDIVNDITTINNTGYIYLKVTHEANSQTCLLYYSTDGINWKQVIQNDQYIVGSYSSTAIDGSLYLGYTGSTGATVNVDLTKTSFQYTPARDPQLTISCDNTIARVADIPTTSDMIFIAEYGTTTYSAITDAIAAGKTVICHKTESWGEAYAQLNFLLTATSYTFSTYLGTTFYQLSVNDSNVWSNGNTAYTDTNLSNLSSTGTKVLDGQWVAVNWDVKVNYTLAAEAVENWTLNNLPNDSYTYEVMGTITASSSGTTAVSIRSNIINVSICRAVTLSGQSSTFTIPVGTDHKIGLANINSSASATINYFRIFAYRRIGTNS